MAAAEETTHKTICLHCGVASEDDEMCPACGRLQDAAFPVGKISLTDTLVGGIGTWFREAVLRPDKNISEIGPIVNPSTGLPMKGGTDTAGNALGSGGLWEDD